MEHVISVFKALSDKNRLRVIAALMAYDELCGCQVTELIQVTGATVSRHMSILLSAGLINSRKDGRWVYYFLNKEHNNLTPLYEWIQNMMPRFKEIKSDIEKLKEITSMSPEELCRKQRGVKCCPE